MKAASDLRGDNLIPIADGRRNKFNVPLILIDYFVGKDLIQEVQKGREVILNVDFDAVTESNQSILLLKNQKLVFGCIQVVELHTLPC